MTARNDGWLCGIALAFTLSLSVLTVVFLAGRPGTVAADHGSSHITSVKGVSAGTAIPGQAITYTVVLTNTGGVTATVRLTDSLPASLVYIPGSASPSAGYVTATKAITWTGTITASSAVSISYSALITGSLADGTMITNTATVDDGLNAPFDTFPVTTTVSSPDLSKSSKGVGAASGSPGQVLTYTVVLSNTGSSSASALVTDTLPVSVTYVPGSATGEAAYVSATRAITWSGVVAAGSAVTISYSGVISSPLDNGTAITNTASINDGASVPFETAPVTTTISSAPNLSTSTKLVNMAVATPGQTITYTVVLTNTGNMNASARLTDTLPVSVTYVSGSATGGATYNSGSRSITWAGLATTASPISITYRAAITSPLDNGTLITNTATVNDGQNPSFDIPPVTTTIYSSPDLSTSRKLVNKPISNPGGTVGYTIVVSNTGGMHTAARVTDTLPLSMTYIANTLQSTMGSSLYDSSSGSIYWAGPALVGTPVTISYQAKVPASMSSGTLVTNTATIQVIGGAPRETPPVTVTVVSNPSRIGWTNLGLYGAIVSDIAVDPVNGVVYQSGSANPGVYRTTNGGESWLPTSLPSNCGPVAVERSSGTTYVNCQQNLWKSVDAGITWTNVLTRSLSPSGFPGIGGGVAVTGTTVYIGDNEGSVWRSTDAGTNWTKRGTASSGNTIQRLAVDPGDTAVVYVTTLDKVFKSANGGANWTDITPSGDTDFHAIGVSPFNSNLVFVGTGNSKHLWKSIDGGQNWTISNLFGPGWWLRFHPVDPNTIYASGVSTDGGITWQTIDVPGGGMDIDPRNPNVIYANSGHGVHKSTDGGATWTEINTGLEEVPIDDVAQNPQDPNHFFVGSRTGRGRSFDGGVNWTWPLAGGAGFAVAMDASNVYVADNGLDKSTDGGRTWAASNLRTVQEADLGGGRSAQIHQIDVVPGDPRHVFAALAEPPPPGVTPKGGVYESTDGGLSWAATGLRDLPVNSIGFGATANGTIIYAGIGDQWGTSGIAGGVYTSTVGNTSVWSRTSIADTYVWKLRVEPSNPLVVYAGGIKLVGAQGPWATSLYKSTNGGATWTNLLPTAPRENAVTALAIDPVFPNNVFYAAGHKIYQSVDGGANWTLFTDVDMGGEGINALLVPLAAPSPVATFTATISGSQAALSWSNPSDSDFVGVMVKYSTQGFPMLSTEGITLTTASGLPGATGVYTHTGVISGTTYYYSAFAYNQAGRYSPPFQAAANSSAAAFSNSASELPARSLAATPRRPAAQAGTRTLYAAAGAGLFATEIEAAPSGSAGQKIYVPFLARNYASGW